MRTFTETQFRRLTDMEVADIGADVLGTRFLNWGERDRRAQLETYLRSMECIGADPPEPERTFGKFVDCSGRICVDMHTPPNPALHTYSMRASLRSHNDLGYWVWDPDAVECLELAPGATVGSALPPNATFKTSCTPGLALLEFLQDNPFLVPAQWGWGTSDFCVVGDIFEEVFGLARIELVPFLCHGLSNAYITLRPTNMVLGAGVKVLVLGDNAVICPIE